MKTFGKIFLILMTVSSMNVSMAHACDDNKKSDAKVKPEFNQAPAAPAGTPGKTADSAAPVAPTK